MSYYESSLIVTALAFFCLGWMVRRIVHKTDSNDVKEYFRGRNERD